MNKIMIEKIASRLIAVGITAKDVYMHWRHVCNAMAVIECSRKGLLHRKNIDKDIEFAAYFK